MAQIQALLQERSSARAKLQARSLVSFARQRFGCKSGAHAPSSRRIRPRSASAPRCGCTWRRCRGSWPTRSAPRTRLRRALRRPRREPQRCAARSRALPLRRRGPQLPTRRSRRFMPREAKRRAARSGASISHPRALMKKAAATRETKKRRSCCRRPLLRCPRRASRCLARQCRRRRSRLGACAAPPLLRCAPQRRATHGRRHR